MNNARTKINRRIKKMREPKRKSKSGKDIASCIQRVANFSKMKPSYLMDTNVYEPELFNMVMDHASPKIARLLKTITELDSKDMREHNTCFKHMIFTDAKSSNYGAKLIASAFAARGFTPAFTNHLTLKSDETLLETNGQNFGILLSKPFGKQALKTKFKKATLHKFNDRSLNVHGDLIRFMILDQGFKEGIDLFDVKYVHLFEPLMSMADQKQAIGRSTRFCGQKGLTFHPKHGWPLHVFRYDVRLPEPINGANTMFELFVHYSNIDMRKVVFAAELEKAVMDASVDKALTTEIHSFKIDNPPPVQFGGGEPHAPTKIMDVSQMQAFIQKNFGQFKYPRAKLENLCEVVSSNSSPSNRKVAFTPTQDFIRHYFTPQSAYKGVLLYHSVGSGKTCSAIATISSSFEREGYTILWVTRHTLKSDIWKNMYQQICSTVIQERIDSGELKLPSKVVSNPMKYMSDNWIEPISYKQFSNLLEQGNKYYANIVDRNGKKDPLRKTLVIIDEAHKLYANNVTGSEKPKTRILEKMIQRSYDVSGSNSARILLMTATPYTEDPMEMIKLLNLLRPQKDALPGNFGEFSSRFLNKDGFFRSRGLSQFQNKISGYVSFIDRSKDARYFAYPIVKNVMVPLTSGKVEPTRAIDKRIQDKKEVIRAFKRDVRAQQVHVRKTLAEASKQCKENNKKDLKACKDAASESYKTAVAEAKDVKEKAIKHCKAGERGTKQGCISKANDAFQESMATIKAQKTVSLNNCNGQKSDCTAEVNTNDKVMIAREELHKRYTELENVSASIQELKGKISGFQSENRVHTRAIKIFKAEIKDLRGRIKVQQKALKDLAKQKKDADPRKTEDMEGKIKAVKGEIKQLKTELHELRSKATTISNEKKIKRISIGRSSVGDVSQKKALGDCFRENESDDE
jgi:hypothetical protein